MSATCEHNAFQASVAVARLEDSGRFMAEVSVTCSECGEPFQFIGLEPGLHLAGARVSIDGLTAHLAIGHNGQTMSPLQQISVTLGGPKQ